MKVLRTDAELVEAARAGNRSAFGEIVERHGSFVCAFAYGHAGGIKDSEELAHEVFVVAWQRLRSLRQPEYLRTWLCGIVKNLHRRSRREEQRRLGLGSSPLEGNADVMSADPSPLERVISDEEERLLSRALAVIPAAYRETLVLYYQEQRAVDEVARALGLSVKTVHDRLMEGRKMLRAEVGAVESALSHRRPRKSFAAGVLAAIAATEVGRPASAAPARVPLGKLAVAGAAAALAVPLVAGMSLSRTKADPHRSLAAGSSALTTRPGAVPLLPWAAVAPPPAAPPAPVAPTPLPGLSFDFEDAILPRLFVQGHLAAGPPRGTNRTCVIGTVNPSWPKMHMVMIEDPPANPNVGWASRPLFSYHAGAVIAFDYWTGADSGEIIVETSNISKRTNYAVRISSPTHRAWARVEVKLRDFAPNTGEKPMEEGDRLTKVEIDSGSPGGEPFYVDNIEVLEAR